MAAIDYEAEYNNRARVPEHPEIFARWAGEAEFYRAKLGTAAFFATHVLSQSAWLHREIVDGSGDVMRLSESQFDLDRKMAIGV